MTTTCIQLETAPSLAAVPSSSVPLGSLRRRLNTELVRIGAVIGESKLNDEMTKQIESWKNRFEKALKSQVDEAIVCKNYTEELLGILTDPFTLAPLDPFAVLGNDGETYGQMSLAVYRLSVPEELRNLSPLHPNTLPFVVRPHPVVRHMTRWLQSYNALPSSKEVERAYLQLLPQQRPMEVEERTERLMARSTMLQDIERKRREAQNEEIKKKAGAMVDACAQKLTERLAQLHIQDLPQEVQERFQKQCAQAQEAFAQLKVEQDSTSDLIKRMDQKFQTEEAEEKAFKEWLNTTIEDKIFDRVKEQAQAFENESLQKINEAAARLQEAARQILQTIQTTGIEIEDLKRKIRELQGQQKKVSDQVDQAGQELHLLRQDIEETRKIIEERNKNRFIRLVAAVGIAAGSIFATWVIACYLKTAVGVTLLPQEGGAALRFTVQSQL